jgi:hypothetical protein
MDGINMLEDDMTSLKLALVWQILVWEGRVTSPYICLVWLVGGDGWRMPRLNRMRKIEK